MIVVRLPPVTHFETRAMEWIVSAMMVGWCVILAQPVETMMQPQNVVLHQWASETFWTWLCGAIGVGRLLALWFNGSWRPSPFVRGALSLLSGLFWMVVSLGLAFSGRAATGLAIYPWLAIADLYSVYRATKDARSVWNLRNGSVSEYARAGSS